MFRENWAHLQTHGLVERCLQVWFELLHHGLYDCLDEFFQKQAAGSEFLWNNENAFNDLVEQWEPETLSEHRLRAKFLMHGKKTFK